MTARKAGSVVSPRLEILSDFQKSLNLSFRDISLLDTALTHRSYLNEAEKQPGLSHNERLEFLGDAVLGQAVAHILYESLEGSPEGDLARIKSIVVSEAALSRIAAAIGLPSVLRMGKGEEMSGGRKKKALLADAFEALVGAVFLDQGNLAASGFVAEALESEISEALHGQSKDCKTVIQEYGQKYLHTLPEYSIDKVEGPEHERSFWASCRLGERKCGPCRGATKKEAEQEAAREMFRVLKASGTAAARKLAEIARLSETLD